MATVFPTEVEANSTARVKFRITDLDDALLKTVAIQAATLTVYDKDTNTIIQRGGSDTRDVSGDFDDGATDYNLPYILDENDTAQLTAITDGDDYERRLITINLQIDDGSSGSYYHEQEFIIKVIKHNI